MVEWFDGRVASDVEENVGLALENDLLVARVHRRVVEVVPGALVGGVGGVVTRANATAVMNNHCRQVVHRRTTVVVPSLVLSNVT